MIFMVYVPSKKDVAYHSVLLHIYIYIYIYIYTNIYKIFHNLKKYHVTLKSKSCSKVVLFFLIVN